MSFGKFKPELLISLVESKPALWDNSLESHRDSILRSAAWKEICSALNKNFCTYNKQQQNTYTKVIMKKWTNIRDAWKKSFSDDKKKDYIHKERLKFLEKNHAYKRRLRLNELLSIKKPHDNSDSETDSSTSRDNVNSMNKRIEESMQEESETGLIQFMDVKEEQNPHISFVKSILPSLSKLDDDEVLEFQVGVLQILQNIRKRSKALKQIASSSFMISNIKTEES